MKIYLSLFLLCAKFIGLAKSKNPIVQALGNMANARVLAVSETYHLYQPSNNAKDSLYIKYLEDGVYSYRAYNALWTLETQRDSTKASYREKTRSYTKYSSYIEHRHTKPLIDIHKEVNKPLSRSFKLLSEDENGFIYRRVSRSRAFPGYTKVFINKEKRITRLITRYTSKDYDMNDSIVLTFRYLDEALPRSYFPKPNRKSSRTSKKD